jgi:hypothetical protein
MSKTDSTAKSGVNLGPLTKLLIITYMNVQKLINNVKFRYQTKDRQSINTMYNVHLWSFFIYIIKGISWQR